jgi:hypothetical protein
MQKVGSNSNDVLTELLNSQVEADEKGEWTRRDNTSISFARIPSNQVVY